MIKLDKYVQLHLIDASNVKSLAEITACLSPLLIDIIGCCKDLCKLISEFVIKTPTIVELDVKNAKHSMRRIRRVDNNFEHAVMLLVSGSCRYELNGLQKCLTFRRGSIWADQYYLQYRS